MRSPERVRRRVPTWLGVALAALCAAAAGAAPVPKPEPPPAAEEFYDLVVANGRVLDPASGMDQVLTLGIRAGRIAVLSSQPLEGRETIDATGLAVAPGFIDIHAHGQNALSYDYLARDGVTSALDLELGVHGV